MKQLAEQKPRTTEAYVPQKGDLFDVIEHNCQWREVLGRPFKCIGVTRGNSFCVHAVDHAGRGTNQCERQFVSQVWRFVMLKQHGRRAK